MIQQNKDFLLFFTQGTSMFPFLLGNEYILVKKVPTETIQLKDVVLFESDNGLKVCHRVVKINPDDNLWFQTKGDRNKFYDAPVRQEAILGQVIAVKRKMNLIGLPNKGWEVFLYKLDCLFIYGIFYLKKFLVKVILFLQQYGIYQRIARPILYKNVDFKVVDEKTGYKFYATKKNKTIAWVYLSYSQNYAYPGWWIWALEVKALYRRLSLGKQLIKNMVEFTKQKGVHILYLNVCNENIAAIKLYESLGFNIKPDSERVDEKTQRTFIYMEKRLNDHKNSKL